jgi:hypothetical protein
MTDWAGFLSGLLPLSSYTSPEEAFIQSINGNWWPLSYSVQPVSRGGTGNGTVAYGEMLYGTGNETMERLGTAAENNSFLMFSGGKPVWTGAGDATGNTNILRVVTGSYRGNGGSQFVTLPVSPKLLNVSAPSVSKAEEYGGGTTVYTDRPCTLGQNGVDSSTYFVSSNGSTSYKSGTVKLSGNTLSLNNPYLCNRSGVTYNWVAIY